MVTSVIVRGIAILRFLHLPSDPELMTEMSNERVQLSKTGQVQFSHPAGTHDDTLGGRTGSLRSKKRNHPIPSSSPKQESELHRTHIRLTTP